MRHITKKEDKYEAKNKLYMRYKYGPELLHPPTLQKNIQTLNCWTLWTNIFSWSLEQHIILSTTRL